MEYLVCIKQVPQVAKLRVDENNNLIREGVKQIINPADLNALTAALYLKEKTGGRITVLTMGPPNADVSLRKCIAMGADRGFIVSSMDFRGSDTLATSYTLTRAIETIGKFDVILTGTQTIDGDTGQVGPELSENLGMNLIGYVSDVDYVDNKIVAKRRSIGGDQIVESGTPVLLSILRDSNKVKEVNEDEINQFSDVEFKILSPEDISADLQRIGMNGSPTVVVNVFTPEETPMGVIIEGDTADDKVNNLVEILKEKTTLGW